MYDDVRKAQSEIAHTGTVADPRMLWDARARARFLFGDDLTNSLDEYFGLLWRVHHEGKAKEGPAKSAGEAFEAYKDMLPIFAAYMRLDHKLPGHKRGRGASEIQP